MKEITDVNGVRNPSVEGEEQVNSAALKTGFLALAALIRRNEPQITLNNRLDALFGDVRDLKRQVAELTDVVRSLNVETRNIVQQALRTRDELTTQLSFYAHDLQRMVSEPLDVRTERIEKAVSSATTNIADRVDQAIATVMEHFARIASDELRPEFRNLEENVTAHVDRTVTMLDSRTTKTINDAIDNLLTEQLENIQAGIATVQKCIDQKEGMVASKEYFSEALAPLSEAIGTAADSAENAATSLHQMHGELRGSIDVAAHWAEEAYKWAKQAHDGTETKLNALENVRITALAAQVHNAIARVIAVQTQLPARNDRHSSASDHYRPAAPATFDAYIARAKAEFPQVFTLWWERLETLARAFDQTKIGNAANERDLYSHMFANFVKLFGSGRTLDVGCGIFGTPYYLQNFPTKLISAIEPLPMKAPVEFELVRGISEYLPWPDQSFSTVISGTSLDHCLSLDRTLSEMRRVLTDDGNLLLWVDLVPNARPYEPLAPDFSPADQFHLFHLDKTWFEPLLEQNFYIKDRIELDMMNFYSKAFYLLGKRK